MQIAFLLLQRMLVVLRQRTYDEKAPEMQLGDCGAWGTLKGCDSPGWDAAVGAREELETLESKNQGNLPKRTGPRNFSRP